MDKPEPDAEQVKRAEETKAKRRASTMHRFSLTDSIQLGEALSGLTSAIKMEAAAEDQLRELMIAAKQSGLAVKNIFEYFDKDGDEQITPDEFKGALEKLDAGRSILNLSPEDADQLIAKFDVDGDGSISMAEFKHYCYNINALCWKAERVRLEAAGEFVGFSDSHKTTGAETSPKAKMMHSITDALASSDDVTKIHETTKLFWRTNEKLDLIVYEVQKMGGLVLSAFDEAKHVNHGLLFIDLTKVKVNDSMIADEVKSRQTQRAEDAARKPEDLKEMVLKDFLANWVMQRLTLEKGKLGIKKVFGDDYEGDALVKDPGCGKAVPERTKREKVDLSAFAAGMDAMQKESQELNAMSVNARRKSQQLTVVMSAFSSMDPTSKYKSHHNKYATAILRGIRKQQIGAFQTRLDDLAAKAGDGGKEDGARSPRFA